MYRSFHKANLCERSNILPVLQYIVSKENVHSGCGHEEKRKRLSRLKTYWLGKYASNTDIKEKLQKNIPQLMHTYHRFSLGTKSFFQDLKTYRIVRRKRELNGINSLSRIDLELLHSMPKDLLKICPYILVSAIPFVGGIALFLPYLFPKQLLSRYYWTPEQKVDFLLSEHKVRFKHAKPLFECIQAKVSTVNDPSLKLRWSNVISCLSKGDQPSAANVISCSNLFADHPYSLAALNARHTNKLLAIHGMSTWIPFKKIRLMKRGLLIIQMDCAIRREGGVEKMSNESLSWALSFRGVYPAHMSTESMRNWLNTWLGVSGTVSERTVSLLLHSPILLAYNEPANRKLI